MSREQPKRRVIRLRVRRFRLGQRPGLAGLGGAGGRKPHRQGKCTTTSCGSARRHTVIIALIPFPSVTHQTIIVLDFGSQYTQLIARRLRELSVYSEVWPPDTPIEKIHARKPVGIIFAGGPKSVSDPGAPACDQALFD